jgi:hypothetical protein
VSATKTIVVPAMPGRKDKLLLPRKSQHPTEKAKFVSAALTLAAKTVSNQGAACQAHFTSPTRTNALELRTGRFTVSKITPEPIIAPGLATKFQFLGKLFKMITETSQVNPGVICWSHDGKAFLINVTAWL